MKETYSSQLVERAVNAFTLLPGVGRKTALRYVLHLLAQPKEVSEELAEGLLRLRREVHYCSCCHNISDNDLCAICANPRRDRSLICVVENLRNVMAVEATGQFKGLYHVLGGVISPMDGIGPSDLTIESLVQRVQREEVKEVILALSTTMEGDTTNFYIHRKLQPLGVEVSVIARGVSVVAVSVNNDEVTLGRSILNRLPFDGSAG